MTKIDEDIVKFIVRYCKENQFYPNYNEIAKGVSRSKSTIHTHMRRLENEGVIIRKADFSSQYRLINIGFILRESKINLSGKDLDDILIGKTHIGGKGERKELNHNISLNDVYA